MYLGGGGGPDASSVLRRHCDAQQTDLVGKRIISRAYAYFPEGLTGEAFFIELSDYEPGGPKTWAHQMHFRDDGMVDDKTD